MSTKICNVCLQDLPTTEFHNRSTGKSKLMPTCKSCTSIKAAKRYIEHKTKIKAVSKQWREKKRQQIHGNFELYFTRLVKRVKTLSIEDCLSIYEKQNGLCALTGIPLTCLVGDLGEHPPTNASLDRIKHGKDGGTYSVDNVRLVCARVNYMRADQSDEELLWWSRQIVDQKQTLSL